MGLTALLSAVLVGPSGIALAHLLAKQLDMTYAQFIKNMASGKLTFSANEVKLIKTITDELNAKIAATVQAQHDPNLVFVNPNYSGSPFQGHALCSKVPYFNGIILDVRHPSAFHGDLGMSFHPNHSGTQAYAEVFEHFRNNYKN